MSGSRDIVIDCVVAGAWPAGLAASAALTARGVEHLVLERGRVGQSRRSQRSLRLNNPGWMNPMLGEQPHDSYLTRGEVVERLDKLVAACPVHEACGYPDLYPTATGGYCGPAAS